MMYFHGIECTIAHFKLFFARERKTLTFKGLIYFFSESSHLF